jgi:N-acetylneuraminic acid mutarotase
MWADPKRADVKLAARADGAFRIEARQAGMAIEVRRAAGASVAGELVDGYVVYPGGGPSGADVIHRVIEQGTEDFIVLEQPPERPAIQYEITLGDKIAGLRLVSRTLEFLDETGTPRLHVSPPYLVDARGEARNVSLDVDGCAYDRDPRGPWGRAVTPPGAAECSMRISWDPSHLAYPMVIDPSWTITGLMMEPRAFHTASVLGSGHVLVAGGRNTFTLKTAELFDPVTQTWSPTGAMGQPRLGHTATVLDSGKVLVAGGAASTFLRSAELFDPVSGTWVPTPDMAEVRRDHTAAVLGSGKVLVAGGYDGVNALQAVELYDPLTDTWSSAPDMAERRRLFTASSLSSGAVLVTGGLSTGVYLKTSAIFDPNANAWFPEPDMGQARAWHKASVLSSGKILVTGGSDSAGHLKGTELYDPVAQAWSPGGDMGDARVFHTASVLNSDVVLVAGGSQQSIYLQSAELYDPVANTWSLIDEMPYPSIGHTASVLGSGSVLLAGGGSGVTLPTAILFSLSPPGGKCATHIQCESGLVCSEGVCCNAPCSGACDVCVEALGAVADGICTVLPLGSPGIPSCYPYLCSGAGSVCPAGCPNDAGCTLSSYCASDGTCRPDQPSGQPCTSPSQCESGYCVEGVCCNEACTATCYACAARSTGLGDGTCALAKPGAPDIHGMCLDQGAPSCKHDGFCDGTGQCRNYAIGSVCLPSSCTGNVETESTCAGPGACVPTQTDCSPYRCKNGACKISCTTNADCDDTAWCDSGSCVADAPDGTPCNSSAACASNRCVDGFCCSAPCSGQCEACDAPGVEGKCVPITGPPHGSRPACGGNSGDPCSARVCDGIERNECLGVVGPGTSCREASCTDGIATLETECDGSGSCPPAVTIVCEPFECASAACHASCSADSDCAAPYRCENSACVPRCQDEHCSPYRCDESSCKTHCDSVDDCISPFACDSGRCVARPSDGLPHDGCGCRIEENAPWSPPNASLMLVSAIAIVGRFRRRRPATVKPPNPRQHTTRDQ